MAYGREGGVHKTVFFEVIMGTLHVCVAWEKILKKNCLTHQSPQMHLEQFGGDLNHVLL